VNKVSNSITDVSAKQQGTDYLIQRPAASLAVSLCPWLVSQNSNENKDDKEGNKSQDDNVEKSCAQLEQNSSEQCQNELNKKVGIFPHKPTTDYRESVRADVRDFEKSRSGEVKEAANVHDDVVVKDIAGTGEDCRESEEDILNTQLHNALSENQFEPRQSSARAASKLSRLGDKEFEARIQERKIKKYFNPGREVPQRHGDDACNLHKYRMKLAQQEYNNKDQNKVSNYYRSSSEVPDQQSASSSHRWRAIVQCLESSIAKTSELPVSSNNFSDRLPTSATTINTNNMDVSSNCINARCWKGQRSSNSEFMQDAQVSTSPVTDRKTPVVGLMDVGGQIVFTTNDNRVEENRTKTTTLNEQRLNNQWPSAKYNCPNRAWLNHSVHVEKQCNHCIQRQKDSNVQRRWTSLTAPIQQQNRNNIANLKQFYDKNAVPREIKSKCTSCYEETYGNALKIAERILHQTRIETFWQRRSCVKRGSKPTNQRAGKRTNQRAEKLTNI